MSIQQILLGIPSASAAEPDGSVYFDGIDDRLTFAATSDFAFDTNDFTIEAFVNRVADDKLYSRVLHFGPYWNNDDAIGLNFDDADHATKVTFGNYRNRSQGTVPSNGRVLISNSSVSSVGWYHLAVTRHNGVFRLFINGILEDTNSSITGNDLETSSTNTLAIAGTVDLMGQEPFNANISNVRVIKGTALYTDSFVPPSSALTDVTNTKLLCCQSATDVTAKAVGGTINVDGAQPSSKNPFPFTTSYAVDFDGNDDYLSLAPSSDLNLDGEFTIESWVKVDDDGWSGTRRTLIANNIGWTTNHFAISLMNSGNSVEENCITLWDYNANSGGSVASSSPVKVETSDGWTHIAVTRDSSNNIRIFKNGTQAGSTYNSSNSYLFGTGETWIGQITMSNLAGAESLDGKISNLRIVKGQALYTSNFTPPTEELTTTSQGAIESNVKLLCCNKPKKTDSTVTPASINSNGDPTASSESVNGFTTGAVTFDGSGDFLNTSGGSDFDFGSGDFTVEAFVRPTNATQTDPSMVALWNFPQGRRSWGIFGNTSGSPASYNGAVRGTVSPDGQFATRTEITGTLTLNSWNHVAFVRNGNTLNFFINGVSQGTATYTGSVYSNTQDSVMVGAMGNPSDNRNDFNGKISNVRVVKGTCLYTVNFTPPTAALTNVTNTKLLCCQDSSSTSGAAVSPGSITEVGDPKSANGPFPILYNYSVDFDGSFDYLSIPDDDAWHIETNYTAECWFNCDALTGHGWDAIFAQWQSNGANATNSWCLEYVGTDLRFYWMSSGSMTNISLGNVSLGAWHHFAFSKSGSTTRIFIDGTEAVTAFDIGTMQDGTGIFTIGGGVAIGAGGASTGGWFNGKISNVRITKGQALYTSAFTPSTEPLTTTSQGATASNVKLLCCNTSSSVTGSITTPGTITANDDPTVALGPF